MLVVALGQGWPPPEGEVRRLLAQVPQFEMSGLVFSMT